jgi:hypothetical protein
MSATGTILTYRRRKINALFKETESEDAKALGSRGLNDYILDHLPMLPLDAEVKFRLIGYSSERHELTCWGRARWLLLAVRKPLLSTRQETRDDQ